MDATTGIVVFTGVTALIGAAYSLFKTRAPRGVHVLMELLTVVWALGCAWLLTHVASELMPARKHDSFAANALASAACFAFLIALVPPRRRALAVAIAGPLLAFLGFSDIVYMRYFGGVMPVAASGSAVLLWDVRDSISELVQSEDAWVGLLAAGAVLVGLLWRTPKRAPAGRRGLAISLWALPVLASVAGPIATGADVSRFLDSKWAKDVLNREDNVWNAGILGAHAREISLTAKNWWNRRPLDGEEREAVRAYYDERGARLDSTGQAGWRVAEGKSLLFVQWEALEQWVIGARVGGREITPFLNRLLGESIYYPTTFDQVASSSTSDCEYLVLNSQHPLASGSVAFSRVDNHFVTVGTVLREQGYDTLSMHAYRRGMWNRAVLHPKWGFNRSLFAEELGNKPKIGWGLDDKAFFKRAAEEMSTLQKPFFSFLITLTSHHPYRYLPRREWKLKLPGDLSRSMIGGYLQSIAYVDGVLEGFFQDLEQRGLLDDMVVVIYGDHDAGIRINPKRKKQLAGVLDGVSVSAKRLLGTRAWWMERVPVIVRLPRGEGGGLVSTAPGGQIDVAPTALHFLGVEPPASFLGRARLPGEADGLLAKWNGNGADEHHTWNEKGGFCGRLADAARRPKAECDSLRERVAEELRMSWGVTENDLAQELAPPGSVVAAAESDKAPRPFPAPAIADAGPAGDAGTPPASNDAATDDPPPARP